MMDKELFQDNPRDFALKLVEDGLVNEHTMLIAALKYMSHDDVRGMLDANELSPRFDEELQTAEGRRASRDGSVRRMKKFKRSDEPDTEWTDPGSTFGIPDRWTQRRLCGLWLNVGNNNRVGPDYKRFAIHETETPWSVFALSQQPERPFHWETTLVASGKATSIEYAKDKAERAARAWKA